MADYMAGINSLYCLCMKASFYPALTWKKSLLWLGLIVLWLDDDEDVAHWHRGTHVFWNLHHRAARVSETTEGSEGVRRREDSTLTLHLILPQKSCISARILKSGSSLCNTPSQREPPSDEASHNCLSVLWISILSKRELTSQMQNYIA